MTIPVMLANEYNDADHGHLAAILMPKLNGIRARYVPGHGFFSRDGKAFAADKLSHIKVPRGFDLDGELYVHGWSLQRINAAASVNSPGVSDDTRQLCYYVYDLPQFHGEALHRMRMLARLEFSSPYCKQIPWRDGDGTCITKKRAQFQAYVADGYEGMMLKVAEYVDGRTNNLLKRKAWFEEPFRFIQTQEGEGKRVGMVGAIWCEAANGKHFKVGSGWSDQLAIYWWLHKGNAGKMPLTVTVRYVGLSDAGIPLNTSFVSAQYAAA